LNFRNLNIRIITFYCKFYFISYPELRLITKIFIKNVDLEILCRKIIIPAIAPKLPPNKIIRSKKFSEIRGLFFWALYLSTPKNTKLAIESKDK